MNDSGPMASSSSSASSDVPSPRACFVLYADFDTTFLCDDFPGRGDVAGGGVLERCCDLFMAGGGMSGGWTDFCLLGLSADGVYVTPW